MSKENVSKIRTAAETALQGAGCLLLLTACLGLFVGTLCYFTGDHVDRAEMNKAFASAFSSDQGVGHRSVASKRIAAKHVVVPPAIAIAAPRTARAATPSDSHTEKHGEELASNSPRESAHPHN